MRLQYLAPCLALALGSFSGPVGCARLLAETEDQDVPYAGVVITPWDQTGALQGDESASLAAGKTLRVDTWTLGAFIDMPVARGRVAGLSLRLWSAFRSLHGKVGAVTYGQLARLAPGLAQLVDDAAGSFRGVGAVDSIKDQGDDALAENVADRIDLVDLGVDVGAMFVGTGMRVDLGDGRAYVELPEFAVGGFFHLSDLGLKLTGQGTSRTRHFAGLGVGLSLRLAPVTFYLPPLGARLQPLAFEQSLFSLHSDGRLRALVASTAMSSQISWRF